MTPLSGRFCVKVDNQSEVSRSLRTPNYYCSSFLTSPEFWRMSVKKFALPMMLILCAVSSLPLAVQGQSEVAEQRRAEISNAIHFDKTTKPLREMFDTGESAKPARGGKDFEPGRPQPVSNVNRPFEDPLAARGNGSIG